MKEKLFKIREHVILFFVFLLLVLIVSCQGNNNPVKPVVTCNKDTVLVPLNKSDKIYSIEEIANMKPDDIIYVYACGEIRMGMVIKNDINKELIWYYRANYFDDINDFSKVEIKPWTSLP